MVVVVIIGLLATLILPNVINRVDDASRTKAVADIKAISSAMSLYRLDNFAYPSTSEGIQSLVTNPGKSTWKGYLDRLPKDPWNNDYQYSNPGQKNANSFDLFSYGSDGALGGEGTAADIGNWEN